MEQVLLQVYDKKMQIILMQEKISVYGKKKKSLKQIELDSEVFDWNTNRLIASDLFQLKTG